MARSHCASACDRGSSTTSVIGWVTKSLLSDAYFEYLRHVKVVTFYKELVPS
jgi:hypothetical protein